MSDSFSPSLVVLNLTKVLFSTSFIFTRNQISRNWMAKQEGSSRRSDQEVFDKGGVQTLSADQISPELSNIIKSDLAELSDVINLTRIVRYRKI